MDLTSVGCIQHPKSAPVFSLCCPECQFAATSTFDLRKHVMSVHLDPSGVHFFELQIFTCSVCGVSSTNHVQIKDHITVHLRKRKADEQVSFIFKNCKNLVLFSRRRGFVVSQHNKLNSWSQIWASYRTCYIYNLL